jgi:hypothetical protein
VSKSHHFVSVGPGGDLELVGDGVPLDDQRVVARGGEGAWQALEDAPALMENLGRATMHETLRPHY